MINKRNSLQTPSTILHSSLSPIVNHANYCNIKCKSLKPRSFCGSDGKTYASKCDLRKVIKCEKKDIRILSKGRCGGENFLKNFSLKKHTQNTKAHNLSNYHPASFIHQKTFMTVILSIWIKGLILFTKWLTCRHFVTLFL